MQAVARGGINSWTQGLEEAWQKAISNAHTGKPYGIAPWNFEPDQSEEMWDAIFGTIPLALVSGAGQVASRPKGNNAGGGQGNPINIAQPQPQTNNETVPSVKTNAAVNKSPQQTAQPQQTNDEIAELEAEIKGLKEQAKYFERRAAGARAAGMESAAFEAEQQARNTKFNISVLEASIARLQPSQTQTQTPPAQPQPLLDLNAQDPATQKLLEQFAREKVYSSTGHEAAEYSTFFEPMFKDNGDFKGTAGNYNAILENYGDEFRSWLADKNSHEQSQKKSNLCNKNNLHRRHFLHCLHRSRRNHNRNNLRLSFKSKRLHLKLRE